MIEIWGAGVTGPRPETIKIEGFVSRTFKKACIHYLPTLSTEEHFLQILLGYKIANYSFLLTTS